MRETAAGLQDIRAALAVPDDADGLPGLRLRTVDGNYLAGTEHRLAGLRGCGAAALPGLSPVVRDGRTGVLTDLLPCEDAYANERALTAPLLALVRPDDLWLADRNFCTAEILQGLGERGGFFLVRYHRGRPLTPAGPERYVGTRAGADDYEQPVHVGGVACRCIRVRLAEPLRDGSAEVRLLTNVPAGKAGAKRLAELYRTRWRIEHAFQELTDRLCCEVNTLGYPKAALFAFALAAVAYNVLVVLRAVLAEGHAGEPAEELSSYHLATEVAAVADGLAIAVPEAVWQEMARRPLAAFVGWLREVAGRLDRRRYRKNPRGPKKPVAVRRTRRGAHRSTARVLLENGQGKSP